MAQYSVRVELHAADEDDYKKLHKAMWNEGFRRVVAAQDGKLYLLPTGSYIKTTDDTLQQTFSGASTAAASTGKSSWIWMVERSRARFTLKEVPTDPDAP